MKRGITLLASTLIAIALFSGPVFALCICLDDCPYDLENCDKTGDGGCWQTRYNRCEDQHCGIFDPYAQNCQFGYTWDEYKCDATWPFPDYYCEKQTDYWETCIPE